MVGERDFGEDEDNTHATGGCFEGCESASDRAPDSDKTQSVPRAGQEVCAPGFQGRRAKDDYFREAVPAIVVGRDAGSSSRAIAQCGVASATDRRFGAGTRVVKSLSDSHPQGAAR